MGDANNPQIRTKLHIKRIKYYNDHNTIESKWHEMKERQKGKTKRTRAIGMFSGSIEWNEWKRSMAIDKKHNAINDVAASNQPSGCSTTII